MGGNRQWCGGGLGRHGGAEGTLPVSVGLLDGRGRGQRVNDPRPPPPPGLAGGGWLSHSAEVWLKPLPPWGSVCPLLGSTGQVSLHCPLLLFPSFTCSGPTSCIPTILSIHPGRQQPEMGRWERVVRYVPSPSLRAGPALRPGANSLPSQPSRNPSFFPAFLFLFFLFFQILSLFSDRKSVV